MTTVETPGKFVEANGMRLHYLEHGDPAAPPLLILPGITSTAANWAWVGEAFGATHHVLTLDLRGHGLSTAPESDAAYTLADYGTDTAELIRVLGLDRPAVLGHSMGARIVLWLAANRPEHIGRALIVDPPVSGPGRRPYPSTLESFLNRLNDVRARGIAAVREGSPGWSEEQIAIRARWLLTCGEHMVRGSHASFENEDIYSFVPQVRCPALFVQAGRGDTVRDDEAAEIARLNPAIRMVKIEDSGHMIPWENMPAFMQACMEFLDGTRS